MCTDTNDLEQQCHNYLTGARSIDDLFRQGDENHKTPDNHMLAQIASRPLHGDKYPQSDAEDAIDWNTGMCRLCGLSYYNGCPHPKYSL